MILPSFDKFFHFPSVDIATLSEAPLLGSGGIRQLTVSLSKPLDSISRGRLEYIQLDCYCPPYLKELKVNLSWLPNYKYSSPTKNAPTAEGWKMAKILCNPKIRSSSLRQRWFNLATSDYLNPIEFLNRGTHSVPSVPNQGPPHPRETPFLQGPNYLQILARNPRWKWMRTLWLIEFN